MILGPLRLRKPAAGLSMARFVPQALTPWLRERWLGVPERGARTGRSPLGWVAVPLCVVYAAGVLAFLSLRFLVPAWPPLLLLFADLGPFLYAPLVLLVPLAVVSRARVAMAALAAVGAVFLVVYLPFLLPRPGAAPAPTGRPITAMTFNLGPDVSQPAGLAAAIDAAGADVVALEELYPAAAQAFAVGLAGRYPYRLLPSEPGSNGLLSRYPILEREVFRPAGVGRAALRASLQLDGSVAQVYVLHPEPPVIALRPRPGVVRPTLVAAHLEAQLADVVARASSAPGPVLVMGDLNMSDQSRPYVVMRSAMHDAFAEAGWGLGFTFPVNRRLGGLSLPGPLVRIDYIWFNDALYALEARVGCQGGSDHCYVLARLASRRPLAP